MKYRFMNDHRHEYPITLMCRVLRVARAGFAVRGYKAPRHIVCRPSLIVPNHLQREFTIDAPNKAWVTDINHVRTWEGWLYLAVVLDLYARKVVGWSMKPTLGRELGLDALLVAVWRRKSSSRVIVHSDQGQSTRATHGVEL